MSTTRSRSIDPLPLSRIRRELFDEPGVAAKIRRSYEISEPLVGLMLEQRVLDLLDQVEQDPERVQWSNNEVFERAVLAIASNSRSWATFRRSLGALRDQLLGFDVLLVARVFEADGGQERITALRSLLRGLTSGRDTKAVIQFAQRLASVGGYYEHLKQVRRAYYQPFSETLDASTANAAATACVALLLANKTYSGRLVPDVRFEFKIAGMGMPLASEFLRNLGWTGFKPDRHVMSMLDRWYTPDEQRIAVQPALQAVQQVFGEIDNSDQALVQKALLGASCTPPDTQVNKADQLVWLYRSTLRARAT